MLGVPLFSGVVYATVGSYIARVIRIFDMRFAPFPSFALTLGLAAAIHANFFAHHFMPDIRLALFLATVVLLRPHEDWFRIYDRHWWMPLPLAARLSALTLRIAEKVNTATGT